MRITMDQPPYPPQSPAATAGDKKQAPDTHTQAIETPAEPQAVKNDTAAVRDKAQNLDGSLLVAAAARIKQEADSAAGNHFAVVGEDGPLTLKKGAKAIDGEEVKNLGYTRDTLAGSIDLNYTWKVDYIPLTVEMFNEETQKNQEVEINFADTIGKMRDEKTGKKVNVHNKERYYLPASYNENTKDFRSRVLSPLFSKCLAATGTRILLYGYEKRDFRCKFTCYRCRPYRSYRDPKKKGTDLKTIRPVDPKAKCKFAFHVLFDPDLSRWYIRKYGGGTTEHRAHGPETAAARTGSSPGKLGPNETPQIMTNKSDPLSLVHPLVSQCTRLIANADEMTEFQDHLKTFSARLQHRRNGLPEDESMSTQTANSRKRSADDQSSQFASKNVFESGTLVEAVKGNEVDVLNRPSWTAEEKACVKDGVSTFGTENWDAVKVAYPNVLRNRTTQQLQELFISMNWNGYLPEGPADVKDEGDAAMDENDEDSEEAQTIAKKPRRMHRLPKKLPIAPKAHPSLRKAKATSKKGVDDDGDEVKKTEYV